VEYKVGDVVTTKSAGELHEMCRGYIGDLLYKFSDKRARVRGVENGIFGTRYTICIDKGYYWWYPNMLRGG